MRKVGNPKGKEIEFDYIDNTEFGFNKFEMSQIILSPHNISLLGDPSYDKPITMQCKVVQKECLCIKKPKENLFDELEGSDISHLVWIDPVGLPLSCLSSILLEWKRHTDETAHNIGLAIVLRTNKDPNANGGNFVLRRDEVPFDLPESKNSNILWMPSIEIGSDILTREGNRLNPYDVYPLVDFSEEHFFTGNPGIMSNIKFLEYFRTRTRNFIYLDVSRPDFIFEKLSTTIESLLKSDFVVLDPVISPGGDSRSYFAEVCSAVLSGAKLFANQDYVPFRSDMKLNGYVILRNRV